MHFDLVWTQRLVRPRASWHRKRTAASCPHVRDVMSPHCWQPSSQKWEIRAQNDEQLFIKIIISSNFTTQKGNAEASLEHCSLKRSEEKMWSDSRQGEDNYLTWFFLCDRRLVYFGSHEWSKRMISVILGTAGGAGIRRIKYVDVIMCGHMQPQQPKYSRRQFALLLNPLDFRLIQRLKNTSQTKWFC